MINRNAFLAFALATAIAAVGGSAYAAGITIGPGGVTVDPGYGSGYHDNNNSGYDKHHRQHHGISQQDAINIAHHAGVRHVDSIREHRGDYEVSGTDRHHRDITVTIDGDNGDVINVDHS